MNPQTPPTTTPNPQPVPAPVKTSKISALLYWLHTHKKLVLIILAAIILLGLILITSFSAIKNRFFPDSKLLEVFNKPSSPQAQNAPSLLLQSSKTNYSLSEKVLVAAIANSQGQTITGFDVLIEYDPEYLSLTERKSPSLTEFQYYGSNSGTLLQTSAVQKTDSQKTVVFKNAKLFEFEFTLKRVGKTSIKTIFSPNATNDSNLINQKSQDILSVAKGIEITIN